MKTFVLCSILFAACLNAAAQSETDCDMAAFVANTDSGVRVRADADRNASVVGLLPANPGGTLVFITGARAGWLKVSSAIDATKTHVFSGTGWIHAPLLAVRTFSRDDSLVDYQAFPGRRSDVLGSLRAELDVNLLGCSGDWLKVAIPMRGDADMEGWLPRGAWCGSPWEDCM